MLVVMSVVCFCYYI